MFKPAVDACVALVKGLWITFRQLFIPAITVQYPEQRLVWPPRSRGRIVLPRDPGTGKHRCTICMLCQRACPNGSIEITSVANEAGKKELKDWVYYLDRCTFCGLCVESCAFNALYMSHEHETATADRKRLVLHLQNETTVVNRGWLGGLTVRSEEALLKPAAPAMPVVPPTPPALGEARAE